jgi:hypothetical protein
VNRAALIVAGAAAALIARRVYLASVAFPNAVRAAGERITADVQAVRRFTDQLNREALTTAERERLMHAYLAGRWSAR